MKLHPTSILGYRVLAVSALSAGTLGLLLPLLPTTPFILVALWASARGAPKLHEKILTHPRFGPSVQAWQTQRAVSSRAKWLACSMMTVSWFGLWLSDVHSGILAALAVLFVAVATYLLARPEPVESS
ncbi:MAG: YbaN family protein [Xanthomonadaceae bacterium]|nr:YbaN family protein [Xanthomonadaceae bacterium]